MKTCPTRLLGLAIVLISLITPTLKAQTTANASGTLVLANVTVIDGNGGQPKSNMTLVISNERILDMYRTGRKKTPELTRAERRHSIYAEGSTMKRTLSSRRVE